MAITAVSSETVEKKYQASPRLLLMCAGNTSGSPLGATSAVVDTISRRGGWII